MIRYKKIAYVTQFVSDQDKALDFYTKVLDFEKRTDNPTPDGPRFVTVGVKDQDFQLVLWPGKPGDGQPIGDPVSGGVHDRNARLPNRVR